MAERRAGILPRIDLGEQTVLQGNEIVGLGRGAAECRLASFDTVLQESDHRRPHRIVEGRGGIEKTRSGRGTARMAGRLRFVEYRDGGRRSRSD